MCLIVVSPKGTLLDQVSFMRSAKMNNDGFGVMWATAGKVRQFKTLGKPEDWWEMYQAFEGHPHAFHHRMATHGAENVANVHPYRVLSKELHGLDLMLMHNGILQNTEAKSAVGDSDTLWYVKNVLRPLLRHNPKLMRDKVFKTLIASHIGTGNKFAMLSSDGVFTILNRKQGAERGDLWLSNTYSVNEYSRNGNTSYGYGPHGGYSHGRWEGGKWVKMEDWEDDNVLPFRRLSATLASDQAAVNTATNEV